MPQFPAARAVKLLASRLKDVVRFQRPVADDSFDGAGSGAWVDVAQVRAELVDALPSRGERLTDGINIASRPGRLRLRFRDDLTPSMRVQLLKKVGDVWEVVRTMQIVAGPAELGRREGVEFMVEDYSSAGNSA